MPQGLQAATSADGAQNLQKSPEITGALPRAGLAFYNGACPVPCCRRLPQRRPESLHMSTLSSSLAPAQSAENAAQPVVAPGSFLTLHYRMAAPGGASIIDTFAGKPATLSLGNGELSPAIEQRLLGLAEGTRATFQLAAGEAFGERNPELVQWVARKLLDQFGDPDERYSAGDVVQFPTPDGRGQYAGAVQQVRDGEGAAVQFDFNHPLAGQPVEFEVHLIGIL